MRAQEKIKEKRKHKYHTHFTRKSRRDYIFTKFGTTGRLTDVNNCAIVSTTDLKVFDSVWVNSSFQMTWDATVSTPLPATHNTVQSYAVMLVLGLGLKDKICGLGLGLGLVIVWPWPWPWPWPWAIWPWPWPWPWPWWLSLALALDSRTIFVALAL